MRTANGDFASLQTAKNGATGAAWSNFFSRQVEKDFVRNDEGNEGVKLLIAGGGTGGHVFPAIAIAKEWLSRGGGREVVLVGTQRGLEMKLVPQAGLPLETLRVAGLKGKRGAMLLKNLAMLAPAMRDAANVLRRHKPVAAFGVGGYAAGREPPLQRSLPPPGASPASFHARGPRTVIRCATLRRWHAPALAA